MGLIQNFIKGMKEKKEKLNDISTDEKIHEKLEQRKLSANERELNGHLEERRQEAIKRALIKIRKQKSNEFWHKDVISQKDLFTNKKNIFKNQKKLFSK